MARKRKRSLEERLSRFTAAQDVNRALGSGIDRLPVSDLAKTILKVKGGEAVAGAAETAAALARGAAEARRGAGVAARDGFETFQRSKMDLARETGTPDGTGRPGAAHPAAPSGFRVVDPGVPVFRGAAAADGPGPRGGGAAPSAEEDLTVRLERLSALHAAGHLDDREYGAAKAKVLGL